MKSISVHSASACVKRLLSTFIASAAVVALSACATASGPQFSGLMATVPDQGDVYLYRTSAFFAVAQSFSVELDGKKVGDLYNASFLHLRMQPGQHRLTVSPGGMAKPANLNIDVQGGQSLIYQYDFVTGPLANVFFLGASIQPRQRELALAEMQQLKAAN